MCTSETDFRPETDIGNVKEVTEVFGQWPSFHDAEILRIVLQREGRSASLECVIHVFQYTSEIDDKGRFVTHNDALVTLRFSGIDLKSMSDFNQQNAIDDLRISGKKPFNVDIPANNGCDATFLCESIDVMSVVPYSLEQRSRDGSTYARKS